MLALADSGDRIARDVLTKAGAQLANLAGIVLRRLFPDSGAVPVAMSGGVFGSSALVRQVFYNSLRSDASRRGPQSQRDRAGSGRTGIGAQGRGEIDVGAEESGSSAQKWIVEGHASLSSAYGALRCGGSRLPRAYALGFILTPLRGWHFADNARLALCSHALEMHVTLTIQPRRPIASETSAPCRRLSAVRLLKCWLKRHLIPRSPKIWPWSF